MSVTYDINTTYIIYSVSKEDSIVDLAGNIYVLDKSFPNYTYSNSKRLIKPTFSIFKPKYSLYPTSPYNDMISVVLGDNIEAGICQFAFCNKLQSVTINYRNDRISIGAFAECINLTSLTIPDTIKSIEELAFYSCGLPTFNFDNITNIGLRAFQDCTFTSLTFNNNYYFIQNSAFLNIYKLTNISFNQNCVGVIQNQAFLDTSLTSVGLPSNMIYTDNSFPPLPGCTVTGGTLGSGVVGTFTLSSVGTDDNGFTVTASTSSTATATGKDYDAALNTLVNVDLNGFLVEAIAYFAQMKGDVNSYKVDISIVR